MWVYVVMFRSLCLDCVFEEVVTGFRACVTLVRMMDSVCVSHYKLNDQSRFFLISYNMDSSK